MTSTPSGRPPSSATPPRVPRMGIGLKAALAPPLVTALKGIIERTYDLETGLDDLAPFIIGDEGYARFYAGVPTAQKVGAAAPAGARMLVREECDGLRAALYLPDRLVGILEGRDPRRILSDENVDDFATLVEEIDHLLCIADRHHAGGAVSLFELELHANVTKALVLELFVARMRGRPKLTAGERGWVKHHLFDKNEFIEEDSDVRDRYRRATAHAVKYLGWLERLESRDRPAELRRFHRRTQSEKLEQLSRL